MEATFDRFTQMANTQLTKMRWALGLNGALAVAFGVVILVWPGISLYALTILFGAYNPRERDRLPRQLVQRRGDG
jgi:uncharacterized membrane protein HdeD (DUF308 family)